MVVEHSAKAASWSFSPCRYLPSLIELQSKLQHAPKTYNCSAARASIIEGIHVLACECVMLACEWSDLKTGIGSVGLSESAGYTHH